VNSLLGIFITRPSRHGLLSGYAPSDAYAAPTTWLALI